MKKALRVTLFALLAVCLSFAQGNNPQFANNANGRIMVSEYGKWSLQAGNSVAVGAGTMILSPSCYVKVGTGNRQIFPLNTNVPVTVVDGANTENVTITAISLPAANTASTINPFACSFTATFANAHNAGVSIISNDGGLEEAINDAVALGSGVVTVDASAGISNTQMTAAAPFANVSIEDLRNPQVQYWNATPSAVTLIPAPTTLTAVTALPSATPVGAYGTGTYHMGISYVDIMGNEGPISADFSEAGLATGSFIFTPPAASTGAVGYTIYISLTSGTYALSYKVPLTSAVCGLTTVETVTAACKVTNATYNQTGSTATVTAITVNTAMLAPTLGLASTTSDYSANSNARTSYAYAPSSHLAPFGIQQSSLAPTIGTAAATTVPVVLGTVTLPAGFMNYVGKTVEICGSATQASAGSTSTITQMQLWWDAAGSNVAGVGVLIGGPKVTSTLVTANADFYTFCQDVVTTVSGAGVTAGSLLATNGFLSESYGAGVAGVGSTGPTLVSNTAVGSLNLAGEARINVVYLHTTGTDGAGMQLTNLTAKVLN